jgi:NAD(P)H-flavin reductase/ferredoxin
MPEVKFNGQIFASAAGETILSCLLRAGVDIRHACRGGLCKSCLMQIVEGEIPPNAQSNLSANAISTGFFLGCLGIPTGDLHVRQAGDVSEINRAILVRREPLGPFHWRCLLEVEDTFSHYPGQAILLWRDDGTKEIYRIANCRQLPPILEIHVEDRSDASLGAWLAREIPLGGALEFAGPIGQNFYLPDPLDDLLVVLGKGSGMAGAVGILREALAQGHEGLIAFFQEAEGPEHLYLVEELQQLTEQHPNLRYVSTVTCDHRAEWAGTVFGAAIEHALRTYPTDDIGRVFVCGSVPFVKKAQKDAYLMGLPLGRTLFDKPLALR